MPMPAGTAQAKTFAAPAARRSIAVTPTATFTIGPGHTPNAARLTLSARSRRQRANRALSRAASDTGKCQYSNV